MTHIPDALLPTARRCSACAAPLAADQRYCLECGQRFGALSPAMVRLIGRAEPAADPATAIADDPPVAPRGLAAFSPRAAAVAVLGVLAFGTVIGSVVAPPASSDATAPVIVAVAPAPATTPPAADVLPDDADVPDPSVTADSTPPAQDTASGGDTAPSGPNAPTVMPDGGTLPDIRHVWLVVLSGHGYDDAFGTGAGGYLGKALRAKGEVVANYYGVAQGELANEIALVSGQGPTPQTAADCPSYTDLAPGTADDAGQIHGDGCVYPLAARSLPDQLTAAGSTWKAYVQGMAGGPAGAPATCRHPALGAADPESSPRPDDPYVTWRNPFVYFHALVDGTACAGGDVDLGQLSFDLTSPATTPAFSYIVPDRCHDGSVTPCADGAQAGLPAADDFLRSVIPSIVASKPYADGGLIAITFAQAPQDGTAADASGCCDPPLYPNLPAPGSSTATPASTTAPASTVAPASTAAPASTTAPATTTTPAGTVVSTSSPGGGRVGLLLLSPFVKAGSLNLSDSYNHFSLLRSIEDLFSLDHLGYAADPAVPAFDRVIYNAPAAKPAQAATATAAGAPAPRSARS